MARRVEGWAMREIGIQYSAPMVRSVLGDLKLVTRRTVKGEIPVGAVRAVFEQRLVNRPPAWHWLDALGATLGKPFRCPYGIAGDRLWVREAWRTLKEHDELPPRDVPAGAPVQFIASGDPLRAGLAGKFRQGMFMPRWASRIDLEVTGVACERLQDITPEQSILEGIEPFGLSRWRNYLSPPDYEVPIYLTQCEDPRDSYGSLWDSLNGEGAWASNPWVFAISFRRITP